ncbi:MAG: GNAT family N-acetyltransferase [Oscillospiraceae bacterium]|nr:GNAT family N-acetyltransferase [Oscillospiraceae bacterium]
MDIRSARESDISRLGELLEQVCRVHREGRPDLFREGGRKYSDEELRQLLQDGESPILVAEEAGRVLGYAFCAYQRHQGEGSFNNMTTLYLDDLCVDADCRGCGAGKALYQAVLELAKGAGCYSVTLNVWARNEGARLFYKKMGLQVQKLGLEQIL